MSHPKRPRFGSHPRPPWASSRIRAQTTEKTIGRFEADGGPLAVVVTGAKNYYVEVACRISIGCPISL